MVSEAEAAVDEAEDAFGAAGADALVIASDPVVRALNKLQSALQDANWAVMFPAFTAVKDIKPRVNAARKAYNAYFAAVREDLGISEPTSETSETPALGA